MNGAKGVQETSHHRVTHSVLVFHLPREGSLFVSAPLIEEVGKLEPGSINMVGCKKPDTFIFCRNTAD
jgi:hypothetical protein